MSISDDAQDNAKRTTWWPLLSALIVASAGSYALARGFGALPPFLALLLVGALATVLYRLLAILRSVFDNVIVRALSAIALMLSMLSGLIAITWALGIIFTQDQNPIERLQAATDTVQTVASTFVLLMFLLLGFLGLTQALTLWWFVRVNAFGPSSAQEGDGQESET
jgi:hypothetical protein